MLGIDVNETTEDNKFTLQTVNCLGACALGPVVVINGEYYGQVTTEKLEKIMSETPKPEQAKFVRRRSGSFHRRKNSGSFSSKKEFMERYGGQEVLDQMTPTYHDEKTGEAFYNRMETPPRDLPKPKPEE